MRSGHRASSSDRMVAKMPCCPMGWGDPMGSGEVVATPSATAAPSAPAAPWAPATQWVATGRRPHVLRAPATHRAPATPWVAATTPWAAATPWVAATRMECGDSMGSGDSMSCGDLDEVVAELANQSQGAQVSRTTPHLAMGLAAGRARPSSGFSILFRAVRWGGATLSVGRPPRRALLLRPPPEPSTRRSWARERVGALISSRRSSANACTTPKREHLRKT